MTCIVPQVPVDPTLEQSYEEMLEFMRRNAVNAVSIIESQIGELKIPVKTRVLEGVSITDELLSYAELHKVDVIVLGSRGLGGFKKLLFGSVASGLSQYSKCPVLIVK